ncbi:ATP-dependent DNA helicase Q-like 4B [Termitomyces sp. J132]|nr:ATP-dependent DNA helicase Q-like 4B [Termitomyces sp. J132]
MESMINSLREQHLNKTLAQLQAQADHYKDEITYYEDELKEQQAFLENKLKERERVLEELEAMESSHGIEAMGSSHRIDYARTKFEWTECLEAKMKNVFGIGNFRLCQEGVCNANMDGRDIVCVMPTGGGKSLTYQLPALLQQGCTVIISPMISSITDQILYLHELGVQAVKITSATSKEESFRITQRLTALADRKVTSSGDEEIKICYVTPEEIQSKTFVSLLQILDTTQQLARFVIEEAHCVLQLGQDFRPDYAKLHALRKFFPDVPIMALSATCPRNDLDNLSSTLGLGKVEDGENAPPQGTVYFTAPADEYESSLPRTFIIRVPDTDDEDMEDDEDDMEDDEDDMEKEGPTPGEEVQ